MINTKNLIRVTRINSLTGFLLLILPTYWTLFLLSNGLPENKYLIIFTLGAFFMRAAGCVVNDILDKDIDIFVERTNQTKRTHKMFTHIPLIELAEIFHKSFNFAKKIAENVKIEKCADLKIRLIPGVYTQLAITNFQITTVWYSSLHISISVPSACLRVIIG